MRMYDIIEKKKHAKKLSTEEIQFFVNGYAQGEIPDYQVSALLMAICLNGMDEEETLTLTLSMAKSGEMLDLSAINGIKVDKHSTGGVGDKTSMIVTPMVASLGIPVAKMSGRGLGHTGGTIDKLESFTGFNTSLSEETFINNVNTIKIAIAGQTKNLAPADKKLYLLRDVTATVDNVSLIAGSIMSKKIAAGSDKIVLDVKTGSGAFMRDEKDAINLAETMVKIGNGYGRETVAVVTDMNQPLGRNVGNILEVKEAIEALKGNGPADLMEVSYTLASQMVVLAEIAENEAEARKMLEETISSGKALAKFKEFVSAQGGDASLVDEVERFEEASIIEDVVAERSGYINKIETEEIGIASLILGGGRENKDSVIDLSVGYVIDKKLGDYVEKGEKIATVYANDEAKKEQSVRRYLDALTIEDEKAEVPAIIKTVIRK